MVNPMDLSGHHVIITGASGDIGSEIARNIARLGGRVSLVARNEEKLRSVVETLEGKGHSSFVADFGNPSTVEHVIQNAFEQSGKFSGAVYCAGVNETRPLKSTKPLKLLDIATVNYLSYVEFCRCVTTAKRRAASLSIVGVSSVNSETGDSGKTSYCSSKAAMNGAMRAIARELASSGVRSNNVLPGWVHTNMYDQTVQMLGNDAVNKVFDVLQYIGEPIEPIDVANAVCFLLSDASRFITGTEMVVGGGYLS